ncbi:hypothetical protein [Lacticaseibacillus sp. 866-1]|uniref:hypothetical protein n=1 Tax=Lacticaseibacillus sp. 866-1 TaxID=2799576 RepID=UPI0019429C12|nr:hypothetical protein [Lacticaseibacillus sp. 866-1]
MSTNQNGVKELSPSKSIDNLAKALLIHKKNSGGNVFLMTTPGKESSGTSGLALRLCQYLSTRKVKTLVITFRQEEIAALKREFQIDSSKVLDSIDTKLDEANLMSLIQHEHGLDVLIGGDLKQQSPAFFVETDWRNGLANLSASYELVIITSGPLLTEPESSLIASSVDAVALEVSYQVTTKRMLDRALQVLKYAKVGDILGVYVDLPSNRHHFDF